MRRINPLLYLERQTICFEEYSKLAEQGNICRIENNDNVICIILPEEINTMKKLFKYSVEELKRLRISINSHCENEHENIEEFLLSFGSTQIEEIIFKGHSIQIQNNNLNFEDEYSSYFEVFPCSSYFFGLRDAMSKVTKFILIRDILLSSKEFSAILRAAKHVEKLYFGNCKIFTDGEYELGEMEGCQIEYLKIGDVFNSYKHSRDYEDSCMKIFLSILGCPNLLRSLRLNGIKFLCGEEMNDKLLSKAKEILGDDYDMYKAKF